MSRDHFAGGRKWTGRPNAIIDSRSSRRPGGRLCMRNSLSMWLNHLTSCAFLKACRLKRGNLTCCSQPSGSSPEYQVPLRNLMMLSIFMLTLYASVMLSRTTQTNEPGRCASLLPSLASIPGPLALIEVGASSGLCLLPDFYGYDWDRQRLVPPAQAIGIAPVFPCQAGIGVPLPTNFPEIVWRAGLDLNPLDVSKDDDVLWLENLVWPEHHQRLDRLRSAINIARQNPPRVVAGDLRNDLQALISDAPKDATVVVFHTAVLSYVSNQQDREDFARKMLDAKSIWISNESPKIFPDIAVKASPIRDDMFLLSVDGTPQAWCGPHGQSVLWI